MATAVVVTLNEAVLAPLATTTVAGTVTDALSEVSETVIALPAVPFRVTVPVIALVVPPSTVVGDRVNDWTFDPPAMRAINPAKFIAPQPDTVSQPTPAFDVVLSGSVPLVPEVTS